jgi:hypothetical protein
LKFYEFELSQPAPQGQRLNGFKKKGHQVEKRVGVQQAAPSRVVETFVRHSAALLSLAVLCSGTDALAQNPRDVFDHFTGNSKLVVTKAAEAEWRKSPEAEISCVEQDFRPRTSSVSALIEPDIPTSGGRVAPKRASCRSPMAQSILLTRLASAQADPYSVDGLTLGSKVADGTPAYQQYQCSPSQKFEGFVWCTKTNSEKDARGRFKARFSILHAHDGAVVYVNRYQEPAYWSSKEIADDIERYSRKIGEEPHIIQLPVQPGLPNGTLATWGNVALEPIVGDELRLLGEDKPLKNGIAIDFIGNFTQSARQGLPIYRLAGGAGFVWAASYNESGRGTLRFSAVDASMYSPPSSPLPATTPAPVAADALGGAATMVEAQPNSPPGMASPPPVDGTAPPPHRGEPLDCSDAPNCGAPTLALSSAVAPPRDPNEVIIHPADGAGKYARESSASNFRSREPLHGMLDLVSTYWVWIISALIASGPAGYWSTRLPIARSRGVQSGQGWVALAFAIGLVVAILLPGQAGLYVDALLFLSFLSIKGFRAGAWLRCTLTRTQVAAAGAAEDARRAAEPKVIEDTPRVAEADAAEDARRAAEEKAAEDVAEKGRRAAEPKVIEDTPRVAEADAAEDARRAAEVKAAENTRCVPEGRPPKKRAAPQKEGRRRKPPRRRRKAAEDARRVAEVKATEDTRRAAEGGSPRKRTADTRSL